MISLPYGPILVLSKDIVLVIICHKFTDSVVKALYWQVFFVF